MKPWQVMLLVGYCCALSCGQLLFKHAALRLGSDRLVKPLWLAVATNVPLICALTLYVALTGLWVYILTVTDLSRAYVFNALCLVLTPLMAQRLFGEVLDTRFFIGLAAIVFGLCVIAWGGRPT
jgi:drug/metabolite transporter (DMT)-like permease